MGKIKNYRDLEVWKKGIKLVVDCYKITKSFPADETYGLGSQIRRAAVSVPANIAEGHGRWYRKEFLRHLSIAYGSLAELETHLEIARQIKYINKKTLEDLIKQTQEIGKMINGLRKSLQP